VVSWLLGCLWFCRGSFVFRLWSGQFPYSNGPTVSVADFLLRLARLTLAPPIIPLEINYTLCEKIGRNQPPSSARFCPCEFLGLPANPLRRDWLKCGRGFCVPCLVLRFLLVICVALVPQFHRPGQEKSSIIFWVGHCKALQRCNMKQNSLHQCRNWTNISRSACPTRHLSNSCWWPRFNADHAL